MAVECLQMWVLSEPHLKVGTSWVYCAEIEVRVNAEPQPLVSKGGCRVAVSFPNLLNTHFLSGYKVNDPPNTHSTPTNFFTVSIACLAARLDTSRAAGGRCGAVGGGDPLR